MLETAGCIFMTGSGMLYWNRRNLDGQGIAKTRPVRTW